MSIFELGRRFAEQRPSDGKFRAPGVVVVEFGGGSCNKAGAPSCRDFCAVPSGRIYNPAIDPPFEMLIKIFPQIADLKPAIVSLVPNGEAIDTLQKSNTKWSKVEALANNNTLSRKQTLALDDYYQKKYKTGDPPMSLAEKMAVTIALGKNAGLNLSLTTNASFLNLELLELFRTMGLETINLSYHPNKPFDPEQYNPDLEHLITKANEAIQVGIIPTITHVLTSQNADTFVALADYVDEHDIFFSVGIANARGGSFSTDNSSIEPSKNQVKMVFRRLLARKLFADRHIRTTIPYLLMAPYLRGWVCDQSSDFFHLSIQREQGKLQPRLNVCSEVKPISLVTLEDFIVAGKLDTQKYLDWRMQAMQDPEKGCPSCTHQCYFESEARPGMDISKTLGFFDSWDIAGKGLRQRYTFRHPIRPTVSDKRDLQNPYLWESLLQAIARQLASLSSNSYWQETIKRSGEDYDLLLASVTLDARDPKVIQELMESEGRDQQVKLWKKQTKITTKASPVFSNSFNWHDARSLQSRALRRLYLSLQKSGKEAAIAYPAKYTGILRHQSSDDFSQTIQVLLEEKRKTSLGLEKIRNFITFIARFFAKNFLANLSSLSTLKLG